MKQLIAKIRDSKAGKILNFTKLAKIVGCFSQKYWLESQKELFPALKQKFVQAKGKDETLYLQLFQYLISLAIDEESKIRDVNIVGLVLKIVQLVNQADQSNLE